MGFAICLWLADSKKSRVMSSTSLEPVYVGQYKFEKNIGQGTYGKVKLAIHSETGEKVLPFIVSLKGRH